jgi:integrase
VLPLFSSYNSFAYQAALTSRPEATRLAAISSIRFSTASMMLSGGENIMWVASQMGHVDTEMVMRTYGKWIPDDSSKKGYQPLNNWGAYIEIKNGD